MQVGAQYLERPNGGRGILLGGVPGVAPANVVILGGGIVGTNAAKMAVGMGAHVTIIDRNLNRLRELDDIFNGDAVTLASNAWTISENLKTADLVVGAVLIPGRVGAEAGAARDDRQHEARARWWWMWPSTRAAASRRRTPPRTPSRFISWMACCTTACRNMPAAVPHTSTFALTNATFPYLLELANHGLERRLRAHAGAARRREHLQRLRDAHAAWRSRRDAVE